MYTIHYINTCESTNLLAAEYLKNNCKAEGSVFVCGYQTAGRGQRGNKWEGVAGQNLLFSLILEPYIDLKSQFKLNIIITIALLEALRNIVSSNFLKIKWSNDIYYKDAKLGGILIENRIQNQIITHSIIGIGLNVNQTIFKVSKAISLKLITNQEFELEKLLNLILNQIQITYQRFKTAKVGELKYHYYQRLYGYQEVKEFRERSLENPATFEGIILGTTHSGQLIIQKDRELLYFNPKEIEFKF